MSKVTEANGKIQDSLPGLPDSWAPGTCLDSPAHSEVGRRPTS